MDKRLGNKESSTYINTEQSHPISRETRDAGRKRVARPGEAAGAYFPVKMCCTVPITAGETATLLITMTSKGHPSQRRRLLGTLLRQDARSGVHLI